jgi:phage terminase large subunit-like protein
LRLAIVQRVVCWGVDGKHYYLLDVYRQRLNYPDLKRKVAELAVRYQPETILIKDKASGTQLIQDLKNDWVKGVAAYVPSTGTSKIVNSRAIVTP